MLSPEERRLLESLPERRFVALSEAEAAELGSAVLRDWDFALENAWPIDICDLLDLRRDAMRYRRLTGTGAKIVLGLFLGAMLMGLAAVVSVVAAGLG